MWIADRTAGFDFTGLASITDLYPVLPKLFRRPVEHLEEGGTLSNFELFLKDKKDGVLILPQAHHSVALDYVVTVKGKRVSLTVPPENLAFDPQK